MKNNTQKQIWEAYGKSWSEPDAAKRLAIFEHNLSPNCVYTDPLIQTSGYVELSDYMMELQKNVLGVKFIITDFKNHHDSSLAHWNMTDGNDNVVMQGASVGIYGADGRLTQMTGFYEPPNMP
jgi:hypothetical protein